MAAGEAIHVPPSAPCDVLVVDDNRLNLIAVEAALEGTFANVVRAESGEAALRLLLHRDFALILLDVQMPRMDGFQTARLIRQRQRTRHTPIIFVTAHHRADNDVLQAYNLGAVDFLLKPVVPEVLKAKANVFVQLQLQQNEVERQARLLREHERREHEQRLEDERRRWHEQMLRRQMDDERRAAQEVSQKASELAQTVAELERLRHELTNSNRELAESDRRKTEFIAILAHELRNPLAPIVTSLELYRLHAGPSDAVVHKAWEVIDRQVRQLRRLVDDLLDVSRITSDKIELRKASVTLEELVEQAVSTSRPSIERAGHELHVELTEPTARLHVDLVRIVQVLANLLNNAARYTDQGGSIRLRAEVRESEVILSVQDNGRGLSSAAMHKVFDMFVQEHGGGGGLGIGLTLVRRLAELHGGSVRADSPGPGRGSTFTVCLPRGDEPETPAPPEPEAPPSSRALRIVLVEDNADIRETVTQLLESWGNNVQTADSGPGGAELILTVRPDVALVDIGLPELDGCDVARRVRLALPPEQLRLVAMTGYGQQSDRERILRAGFDLHLIKPVTAQTLRTALTRCSLRMGSPTH